jgi:hypothetical protein
MLLIAHRGAGLLVNILEDNIEMDIEEMALMTSGINMINIESKDKIYKPKYFTQTVEYFDHLYQF